MSTKKKKSTTPVTKNATKPTSKKVSTTHRVSSKSRARGRRKSSSTLLYGIFLAFALVLLVGVGILVKKNQNDTSSSGVAVARMTLESDTTPVKSGDVVVVKIYADSGTTDVNAVRAVVAYPSDVLELTDISDADSAYPVKAYQLNEDGEIEVVRGVIGGVQGKQLVAVLSFTAKQAGDAEISFDQANAALVDSTTNKNILDSAKYSDVTVEVQ